MFILGVAQVGPAPVLIAATIWVYAKSGARVGERLPRMGHLLPDPRQLSAPFADQARSQPAAPLDLRGRDWWAHRVRRHRALHRAGGAGGRINAARRWGAGRGATGAASGALLGGRA